MAAVLLWLVLFGSKFLVLEAVNLVFGTRVSLGGFFSVTLLILVLLLSRAAVRRLLQRPTSAPGARAESRLDRGGMMVALLNGAGREHASRVPPAESLVEPTTGSGSSSPWS